MYLKSIEIQGFKSFAQKTVLVFHEGVTGIVGPNGSGKSNIADAVRWVLGEQKVKSLRGASMQDVIFAGTQLRKPQGFAYVAITLDNSDRVLPVDYREVTVSRRLYRSGESEYMINGQAVRLRDVQELFYDTGIGREGYSIIGQGQIDAILNGKPEERRGLFDEAAGIVKFKRRKQIAAMPRQSPELLLIQRQARGGILGQQAQPGRGDPQREQGHKGLLRGRAGRQRAQLAQAAGPKLQPQGQRLGALLQGCAGGHGAAGKEIPALRAGGQQDGLPLLHQQADFPMGEPLLPHEAPGKTAKRTIAGIDDFQQGVRARQQGTIPHDHT